jgi:hypothetical protein
MVGAREDALSEVNRVVYAGCFGVKCGKKTLHSLAPVLTAHPPESR